MHSVNRAFFAAVMLIFAALPALAQDPSVAVEGGETEPAPVVWLHLTDGRKLQVDEATEEAGGVWFRRGNISTFLRSSQVARVEREVKATASAQAAAPAHLPPAASNWRLADAVKIEDFFTGKFGRPLPVTAYGQSRLHSLWGYDHRNSLDVGVHPDSPEGRVLIQFLRAEGIPFLAFRGPVPGVASGPHIHIGRPSPRIGPR